MFPVIKSLQEFVSNISHNPFFRVQQEPNGFTVVCYMLQDEQTFIGENEAWAKECRGITFDREGNVASRTMHKFQNIGENEQTQIHMIPWHDVYRVTDKRDGSMITFVLVDGEVHGKTKKTFSSLEAIAATKHLHKNPNHLAWVKNLLEQGITPTFEFTSPRFPIVLTYEKDELTLLQVRRNVTGEYAVFDETGFTFKSDSKHFDAAPFTVLKNEIAAFSTDGKFDTAKLLDAAVQTEGVEGWIVQATTGQMWKMKTVWYCKLHHAVTFVRYRDIARAVVAGNSDDTKASFSLVGRSIQPIVEIENKIAEEIRLRELSVQTKADTIREEFKEIAESHEFFKTVAAKYSRDEDFGQVVRVLRGQKVDYVKWYESTKLDDWSLEVIPHVSSSE